MAELDDLHLDRFYPPYYERDTVDDQRTREQQYAEIRERLAPGTFCVAPGFEVHIADGTIRNAGELIALEDFVVTDPRVPPDAWPHPARCLRDAVRSGRVIPALSPAQGEP